MLFESKSYFNNEAWEYSSVCIDWRSKQNPRTIILNKTHTQTNTMEVKKKWVQKVQELKITSKHVSLWKLKYSGAAYSVKDVDKKLSILN